MRIQFWGTRGSLPRPGPRTIRYGGNTACVSVYTDDGTLIVLDCGTGAFPLGQQLSDESAEPIRGHLLITHTHWDHIQGFPFFRPLFAPDNEWDIYAPKGLGKHLEETLAGQMDYTYFPVTLDQMGATIRYHELLEGSFDLGGIRITAQYLNHPVITLGYKIEAGGAVVVYATDHEPHARYQLELDGEGFPNTTLIHPEDRRHVAFLAGADLLIHDTTYTAEEYLLKVGWGHTSAEQAVDFAIEGRVKRLALFHHEPLRDDEAMDRVLELCQTRAATAASPLEVFVATELQIVHLSEHGAALERQEVTAYSDAPMPAGMSAEAQKVLIVDDDPETVRLLTKMLRREGFQIFTATDGVMALKMARSEHPDLVLLDWQLPGLDGLDVTRALRADSDPRVRDVHLVLLTATMGEQETAEGFAAGVSDYLTKPFTLSHVRSRVDAWLLRGRAACS